MCISPFGTIDIEAEQICDILGLTVNGRKIDSAGLSVASRGFDWSGRTTYWESTHMMEARDDARLFMRKLSAAFPGSVLVQPAWGGNARVRCRQIKFLMDSDEVATLGIRYDKARLAEMLAAEEVSWTEYEDVFTYGMVFSRRDRDGDDVTWNRYICSRGAAALNLDYDVVHHRRYRVRMEFPTADAEAQSITRTILAILDDHFCRGLRSVNLATGATLIDELPDEEDERSYSKGLREACLQKPNRYLFVGVRDTPGADPVFFGARPY